ncbi:hypothetical protein BH09VER1_BH09VER1_25760 [soil metagenome]
MKLLPLILATSLLGLGLAQALVVQPAPNVAWVNSAGKLENSVAFKNQPVVVVIAPSPKSWIFRAQVGQLQKMYERYAAEKIIFIAAFTKEQGLIKSNIPFVLAADGPRTGFDYQITKNFGIAVIGRDGNLDCLSSRVLPAQRIYDIVNNSFVPQAADRRP